MPRHNQIASRRSGSIVVQSDPILSAQLAEAQRQNLVSATRVHGGLVVASAAMQGAVTLSHAADVAFKTSPMGEDVYRSIVMAYGNFVVGEIHRLGIYGGGQR
jgi:hypothetical protein